KHAITLAVVTASADDTIIIVTDDAAQRTISARSGDRLLITASGKFFSNRPTLSPPVHRQTYEAAPSAGAHSLAASTASTISQAREAKLYLMIAGDEPIYEQVKPILEDLSVNRRFIGGPGRAAEVKALVNMVMNINTAALAEGLGLAAALGHDLNL